MFDLLSRPLSLLAALALLTASCVAPPTGADYLAVGFRTPEQAFKSYQTAMAGDQIDLEYRCLGQEFRRANELDGMTYRVAREELLSANPFLKWVARGEIIESERLAPDRHRLLVAVKVIGEERFWVELQREDYFEAFVEDRSVFFGFERFEDHVFVDPEDPSLVYGFAQAPGEVDPSRLTELSFGREWRIAGFAPVEAPSTVPETAP